MIAGYVIDTMTVEDDDIDLPLYDVRMSSETKAGCIGFIIMAMVFCVCFIIMVMILAASN